MEHWLYPHLTPDIHLLLHPVCMDLQLHQVLLYPCPLQDISLRYLSDIKIKPLLTLNDIHHLIKDNNNQLHRQVVSYPIHRQTLILQSEEHRSDQPSHVSGVHWELFPIPFHVLSAVRELVSYFINFGINWHLLLNLVEL